jgi:hypothetical protein
MRRDVQSSRQNDSVRKRAGVALDVLLVSLENDLFQQKLGMFAVDFPQKDVPIQNVGDVVLLVILV